MSDAYRNIADVADLLHEHDVHIVEVDHDHDYRDGDSMAEFEITVSVPVYERQRVGDADD